MDMITIIAITNGIQYLYKFMKIAGIYYSSVEIFGKITIQQTVKHIDNVATIYDVSTFAPCLLYTSPSPRDGLLSRMPSSA